VLGPGCEPLPIDYDKMTVLAVNKQKTPMIKEDGNVKKNTGTQPKNIAK